MKLFVVFILVCLPLLGFSQDEVTPGTDTTAHDEAALYELEKAREDRQRSIEAVSEVSEKVFDPTEELKQLGYDQMGAGALMDIDALNIMERAFKEAKMHTFPRELIRENILKSLKDHPLGGYISSSPRLLNFAVDLLKDEYALISLIQIFKNKPRLKIYLYVWIVIMFSGYFTRKLFISKYWNGFTRAFASMMFSFTISVITLSSFCLIFETEVKPILIIIKRYI